MPANAYSVTSMAACPQLPADLVPEPRGDRTNRLQPSGATDIVTISGNPTLGVYLSGLFQKSGWTIARTRTCADGVSFVRDNRAAVAVCEETLPDGCWYDAAAALNSLPDAPALIVIGDDPAIAQEVEALGGFDALVRPLREAEVVWSIASAWHAWMRRRESGGSGGYRCSDA